eukprot:933085-Pelagomonas_calceolata.AAC.1
MEAWAFGRYLAVACHLVARLTQEDMCEATRQSKPAAPSEISSCVSVMKGISHCPYWACSRQLNCTSACAFKVLKALKPLDFLLRKAAQRWLAREGPGGSGAVFAAEARPARKMSAAEASQPAEPSDIPETETMDTEAGVPSTN